MEVKLDKRYPIAASVDQAWAVLRDIRAVAACMPGAQITEQLDDTHFKGTVKSKVGPAVMSFGGDIELQGLDADQRTLQMLGKGADKAGSSASMQLSAQLVAGDSPDTAVLVGQATIVVSGKLAQFGSRLLVPVSDAMLAQFADNFRNAAQAVVAAQGAASGAIAGGKPADPDPAAGGEARLAGPASPRAPDVAAAPVKELNALALMWAVFKGWLGGLFGKRG
jgi:carbon monoxide dehydrogenase subunit G